MPMKINQPTVSFGKRYFVVLLKDKDVSLFAEPLLKDHITYLDQLHNDKMLILCGPFVDNLQAILILQVDNRRIAEAVVQRDPFVIKGYYRHYEIHEIHLAMPENHWLIDCEQTKNNSLR
jgi:uncharacterized protein